MIMTQSTITLQKIVNIAQSFGDIEPVLNVAGDSSNPALIIATDVMNAICGVNFPHKWNEINLPPFYTNSWQQDDGGSMAYYVQSTAGAINPTWTFSGTNTNSAAIATFKPAAGGVTCTITSMLTGTGGC